MAKKGFFSRLIEGPERSESYARTKLPTNRWQLGWDVFKTNFTKLILINLLALLFMLPLAAIIFFRSTFISVQAANFPFAQNIGIGYPALGTMQGLEENILVVVNFQTLVFLPIAAIFAAVGISGGMYVMRNLIWTEGVFVGADFWRGVKKNFFVVLGTLLIYSILIFLFIMSISLGDYMIKTTGEHVVWLTIAKVISYMVMAFITIMAMYMLSVGVTYELKFTKLIKNAGLLTLGLLPSNLFFACFALLPLLFIKIIPVIGYMLVIFFGLSYFMLIWTDYSQWVFDKFINDKVPGAKKNRGIYEKVDSHGNPLYGTETFDEGAFDTTYLNKRPIKPITDYDVELVELPTSFTREDLKRLEESKEAMRKDSDAYVQDHLNQSKDDVSAEDKPDTDNSSDKTDDKSPESK